MTEPRPLPHCPRCDQPPVDLDFFGLEILPFFCGNPDCDVQCWDPRDTREQFEATARVLEGEWQ